MPLNSGRSKRQQWYGLVGTPLPLPTRGCFTSEWLKSLGDPMAMPLRSRLSRQGAPERNPDLGLKVEGLGCNCVTRAFRLSRS